MAYETISSTVSKKAFLVRSYSFIISVSLADEISLSSYADISDM